MTMNFNTKILFRVVVPGGRPLCDRAAALRAAAVGQPDRDLCVLRLELT